jgi:type II secretory pathway component HofQ
VEWVSAPSTARRTVAGSCLWLLLGATIASQGPQRPGQLQTLPLTQLDERAHAPDLDNRPVTLTFAQPVPVSELLLQLVRGTSLSIVPEPNISGTFIGELKNVTVRQALGLVLPPLGLDYSVDGSFVRVFRRAPETRIFDLNYIATERTGTTLIASAAGAATAGDRSSAAVGTTTKADVFGELAKGVQTLLSERALFNVDRKAGLMQVTDFPERLDRVGVYLEAVQDRVHRQAQIDARVLEVELNDDKASGIDWTLVASQLTSPAAPGAPRPARRPALTGLRVTDLGRLMELLAEQGKVTTVATPRLLAMNNEPAIVRTESVTLSVVPQIAGDAILTLSLSPIVKGPTVAEADMLARVADGETLVVSGFNRDRETRERRNAGISGGWFGRTTVVTRKRIELVVLLTPRVLTGTAAQ